MSEHYINRGTCKNESSTVAKVSLVIQMIFLTILIGGIVSVIFLWPYIQAAISQLSSIQGLLDNIP